MYILVPIVVLGSSSSGIFVIICMCGAGCAALKRCTKNRCLSCRKQAQTVHGNITGVIQATNSTASTKFCIYMYFYNPYNNTSSTLKLYLICIVFQETPDNCVYIRDICVGKK